jgi:protein-L-isoaspartate(D-aspartate) O-methyltransferase
MKRMDDQTRRALMVKTQIAARGIRNPRVLEAMTRVPRHVFVPAGLRHRAYADEPLPLGEGQTISQPYIVALMTETLDPQPWHRVLEVGTGSGYQAAVLSLLAREVVSVERHQVLADRAREVLASLGLERVEVAVGDGTEGYGAAPFDRILITAGAPSVPEALKAQIADGGRMVVPVGGANLQHLISVDRSGGLYRQSQGGPCVFVPLIGRQGWPSS